MSSGKCTLLVLTIFCGCPNLSQCIRCTPNHMCSMQNIALSKHFLPTFFTISLNVCSNRQIDLRSVNFGDSHLLIRAIKCMECLFAYRILILCYGFRNLLKLCALFEWRAFGVYIFSGRSHKYYHEMKCINSTESNYSIHNVSQYLANFQNHIHI